MKKYLSAVTIALAVLSIIGCKEEEDPTFLSMTGTLTYEFPEYVLAGDTFSTTVTGISRPDGVKYMWYCGLVSKDTVKTADFSITFPDSLGTFTVVAIAKADGYYSSTASKTFTIFNANRSMTGVNYDQSIEPFVDARDGKTYHISNVGSLDWMAQNLDYEGCGAPYENSAPLATMFGRLYSWNEATGGETGSGLAGGPRGICPEGWTIPTREDWEDFAKAVSGSECSFDDGWAGIGSSVTSDCYLNGERCWDFSPDNLHKNLFCWNALPAGSSSYEHKIFQGLATYGFWWSSAKKGDDKAFYRLIYYNQGTMPANIADTDDFGASVRCVRLHE